jgi:hypothetical protein
LLGIVKRKRKRVWNFTDKEHITVSQHEKCHNNSRVKVLFTIYYLGNLKHLLSVGTWFKQFTFRRNYPRSWEQQFSHQDRYRNVEREEERGEFRGCRWGGGGGRELL